MVMGLLQVVHGVHESANGAAQGDRFHQLQGLAQAGIGGGSIAAEIARYPGLARFMGGGAGLLGAGHSVPGMLDSGNALLHGDGNAVIPLIQHTGNTAVNVGMTVEGAAAGAARIGASGVVKKVAPHASQVLVRLGASTAASKALHAIVPVALAVETINIGVGTYQAAREIEALKADFRNQDHDIKQTHRPRTTAAYTLMDSSQQSPLAYHNLHILVRYLQTHDFQGNVVFQEDANGKQILERDGANQLFLPDGKRVAQDADGKPVLPAGRPLLAVKDHYEPQELEHKIRQLKQSQMLGHRSDGAFLRSLDQTRSSNEYHRLRLEYVRLMESPVMAVANALGGDGTLNPSGQQRERDIDRKAMQINDKRVLFFLTQGALRELGTDAGVADIAHSVRRLAKEKGLHTIVRGRESALSAEIPVLEEEYANPDSLKKDLERLQNHLRSPSAVREYHKDTRAEISLAVDHALRTLELTRQGILGSGVIKDEKGHEHTVRILPYAAHHKRSKELEQWVAQHDSSLLANAAHRLSPTLQRLRNYTQELGLAQAQGADAMHAFEGRWNGKMRDQLQALNGMNESERNLYYQAQRSLMEKAGGGRAMELVKRHVFVTSEEDFINKCLYFAPDLFQPALQEDIIALTASVTPLAESVDRLSERASSALRTRDNDSALQRFSRSAQWEEARTAYENAKRHYDALKPASDSVQPEQKQLELKRAEYAMLVSQKAFLLETLSDSAHRLAAINESLRSTQASTQALMREVRNTNEQDLQAIRAIVERYDASTKALNAIPKDAEHMAQMVSAQEAQLSALLDLENRKVAFFTIRQDQECEKDMARAMIGLYNAAKQYGEKGGETLESLKNAEAQYHRAKLAFERERRAVSNSSPSNRMFGMDWFDRAETIRRSTQWVNSGHGFSHLRPEDVRAILAGGSPPAARPAPPLETEPASGSPAMHAITSAQREIENAENALKQEIEKWLVKNDPARINDMLNALIARSWRTAHEHNKDNLRKRMENLKPTSGEYAELNSKLTELINLSQPRKPAAVNTPGMTDEQRNSLQQEQQQWLELLRTAQETLKQINPPAPPRAAQTGALPALPDALTAHLSNALTSGHGLPTELTARLLENTDEIGRPPETPGKAQTAMANHKSPYQNT